MITCWAQTSDRRLATMRPAESIPPPGGNPTKSRTTRAGQGCARATRGRTGSAAAPAANCRNCLRWGSFIVADPSSALFDHLVGAVSRPLTDREMRDTLQSREGPARREDRKSTRLNSSHLGISYAVFCLKKKKQK